MTDYAADFDGFAGRAWLNTAHQGAMPRVAAEAAREAIAWKLNPRELTAERFQGVPSRVRAALATLINVDPDEIVLANSASYGLHLIANAYPWAAGDEVLLMAGDFPSDVLPWLLVQERMGVQVRRVDPRDHVLTADELAAAITPNSRIFCTPWVHSFSGRVADLDALGEVCRDRDVFMVVNGSQAIGARPFDAEAVPADALISVGFKWLCGPYGTGFAWIRPRLRERLRRVKAYWLSQFAESDLGRDDLVVDLPPERMPNEFDIFGTANFNNYVPWAVALEYLLGQGIDRIARHDETLVDRLVDGLRTAGALLGPTELGSRSTLVFFSHPDRAENARLHAVLAEGGVDLALRSGVLRASPHLHNTTNHIDRLLEIMGGELSRDAVRRRR